MISLGINAASAPTRREEETTKQASITPRIYFGQKNAAFVVYRSYVQKLELYLARTAFSLILKLYLIMGTTLDR